MRIKSYTFQIVSGGLAIVVTSLCSWAQSEIKCKGLVSKISAYNTSIFPLKELNNATLDLVDLLQLSPHNLDSNTLIQRVRTLELLAENYFRTSHFSYRRIPVEVTVRNLKNGTHKIRYHVYELSGMPGGDEMSRMVYGLQSNPHLKAKPLKVNFDVLYLVNHSFNDGHFEAPIVTIHVGPHVMAREISRISPSLRHEIQHYIEEIKILSGEMTLARATFRNLLLENSDSQKDYSMLLRLDDVESHLRDLRALLNSTIINTSDEKLLETMKSQQKIDQVRSLRKREIQETITRLEKILIDSKATMGHVREILDSPGSNKFQIQTSDTGLLVNFEFLPKPYLTASFRLDGLIKPEHSHNRAKVTEVLLDVLKWNESRIAKAQDELQSLIQKCERCKR